MQNRYDLITYSYEDKKILAVMVVSLLTIASAAEETSWTSAWLEHVSKIQEVQPHWVTPLVTVTPRLEQEIRFDYVDQLNTPSGHELQNYGNGKGLEIIPTDNIELILNVPPYLSHNNIKIDDGFGDFAALIKYRILSANAVSGNYILTAFLGVSFPTGQYKNGSPTTIFTPSIAGGKGWGNIDIQSTVGVTIPDIGDTSHTILWNTSFQYKIDPFFWPEVEFNYSHFTGGPNVGRDQAFVTPGIMFGRFPIANRVGFTVGAGMQIGISEFKNYDHAWLVSARLPF